jgi:hypothetical protein
VISVVEGKRRYLCTGCGGLLCGVAVLKELAGAEHGQHLWSAAIEAEQPGETGPCPFCKANMKATPLEHGRLWICVTCEMAWVDRTALGALRPDGSGLPVYSATIVAHCGNCGAPVEHSWDEQCPYCGAALETSSDVTADSGGGEPPVS